MTGATSLYAFWALILGAVSAVSLPLGSLVGLNVRFPLRFIAIFAAFGAGALIAALSVELVAPTAFALTEHNNAEIGEHAYTHFFAMLAGGVLGGLVFVALDAVINKKGGYLRKTSTTLAYLAKRRRDDPGGGTRQTERSGFEHSCGILGGRNVQVVRVGRMETCWLRAESDDRFPARSG